MIWSGWARSPSGCRRSPEPQAAETSSTPRRSGPSVERVPLPAQAPSRRQGRRPLACGGGVGDVPRAARAGGAPAPGGVRRGGRRVPHHPGRLASGGACGRRQRRLRRPGDRRDRRQHRGQRPDQDPAAPRPRGDRREPEALLRRQRQHEPAQLPVEPRDRVLLRRRGDGGARSRRLAQPAHRRGVPRRPARRRLVRPATGGDVHRHQPRLGRPGEPRARAGDAARHRLGVARRLAVRGGSALGRLPGDRRLQPAGRAVPRARTTRRTTGACCTSRRPRRCPPRSTSARS